MTCGLDTESKSWPYLTWLLNDKWIIIINNIWLTTIKYKQKQMNVKKNCQDFDGKWKVF